ncbi:MAG: gamma-glutamyltransferase [Acidobacteriota bacterium]
MIVPRRLALLLVLVVACKHGKPHPHEAKPDKLPTEPWRTETSDYHVDPSVVGTGKTFVVASESPQATKVGHDVLAAGGNAVDAVVATAFAMAVTHPSAGNLGGGGFAVVRAGKGNHLALDFREVAPGAATDTMYLDAQGKPTKDSLFGDRAAGVPGTVAGLWALHEKLGKKPWKELVAPAIALARDGFAVDGFLHASIERRKDFLAKNPATAAIWVPNGKPRETGEIVKIPELQAALERIADKGADGFYKGPTAQAIVDEMKRGGGIITAKDLEDYKPEWRQPIELDYRGHHITTMPLPSSGGVVMAMSANMLRDVDLAKLGWHSAQHIHWLVEVWRRAFAARNILLADPAFVKEDPVARLVSKAFDDKLAATIGPKATPSQEVPALLEGNHTTNISVVDKDGMAVALTYTLNLAFGSGVTVPGAGFLLNDEMDDFAAKPGSPNAFGLVQGAADKIEPGKRPLSSMTPTLVEDSSGQLFMVVGAGGGPRIITAVWQTISNVIDFHLDIDAAVAAPRVHHQHEPDVIKVEADAITKNTEKELRAMGYKVDWGQPPREFGAVTAILGVPSGGWKGTADPRGGGAAMGD